MIARGTCLKQREGIAPYAMYGSRHEDCGALQPTGTQIGQAPAAGAATATEPWDANALPDPHAFRRGTERIDVTDDLVTWDYG